MMEDIIRNLDTEWQTHCLVYIILCSVFLTYSKSIYLDIKAAMA